LHKVEPPPSASQLVEPAPEVPFYIPATGPTMRPRRTLKHDDFFAVFDSHGDIGATAGGPDGMFYLDTRYLSHMELLLNGMQPLLLGSNVRDDNTVLTVDLTNPDFFFDQHLVLPKDTVHIVRSLFLWRASTYQRLRIQNHGDRPVQLRLSLAFAADFADLFEVRGTRRLHRGKMGAHAASQHQVKLSYEGLDGEIRRTVMSFEPWPTRLGNNVASYALELAPGKRQSILVTTTCCRGKTECLPYPFFGAMRSVFQEHNELLRRSVTVVTSNEIFNELIHRSMADLAMLTTDTPEGPYPYAGIPWYSTTFGRDALITAMQMLWCDSRIAKGVLRRLAAYQAKDYDPLADAEPGKIVHEMRNGEMAALREIPFGLYYGSVDSSALFVLLAGLYCEHTGDLAALQELWPNVEAALAWIDGPGDPDHDGFVEYHRADENGLLNQGWKDSQDAIFHADGRLAEGPIALCEVQGYVYAAKIVAARCARRLGKTELAERLGNEAKELAAKFEEAFWCEDIGTYALALDGEKKQCRVRTSNAGQVLFSGIARPDRAEIVVQDLLRPSFFSGWGIRTVAREEARYNPMSYHNGSIWPHDNAMIAAGFARYGHKNAIDRVFKGLFEAATYMDLRRLPELFCGFQRGRGRGPTLYPVACAPQAWAAGAPLMLLQSTLGLEFDPARNEILLRNPHLPPFLEEATMYDLRLGASTVDLMLRRHGSDVSLQVLRNEGQIRVAAVYS
jgi:glycogen debranching enzyme